MAGVQEEDQEDSSSSGRESRNVAMLSPPATEQEGAPATTRKRNRDLLLDTEDPLEEQQKKKNNNKGEEISPTNKKEEQQGDAIDPNAGNPYNSHGTMIAHELNMLTPQERERILHDLHGVSDDIISGALFPNEDKEEEIDNALDELQKLWDHECLRANNGLLRLAEEQYPERMKSRDFLLMFLRANEYNPRLAFGRILLHLEHHQQLFGEAKVGKRITMDDLSASDRLTLETGHLQLLPESDRSGRLVVFVDAVASGRTTAGDSNHRDISVDSMLRVAYYVLMAGLEDNEQAQECGVVIVLSYLMKEDSMVGLRSPGRVDNLLAGELALLMEGAARLFQGLPLKLRALHACVKPQNSFDEGFYALQRFLTRDCRVRSRIHRGSLAECRSALNAFGIPSIKVPLSASLSIERQHHNDWIRYRENIEALLVEPARESSETSSLILVPSRGVPTCSSSGCEQEEQQGAPAPASRPTTARTCPQNALIVGAAIAGDHDNTSAVVHSLDTQEEMGTSSRHESAAAAAISSSLSPHDPLSLFASCSSRETRTALTSTHLHQQLSSSPGLVVSSKSPYDQDHDPGAAGARQSLNASLMMIETPSRQDVLFGRGRRIQEHHGNILLNSLIEAVRERRDGLARRSDKTIISQTIVTKVKQAGGRFLKQSSRNPNMWEEADDEAASRKVSHAFRSLRQSQRLREASEASEKRAMKCETQDEPPP